MMRRCSPFLPLLCACPAAGGETRLSGVVYVSRHGIRSPYGPPDGRSAAGFARADDWSAWTAKKAKGAEDYGMSEAAFDAHELTPHGRRLMPLVGAYARESWRAAGLEVSCDAVAAFADDSTRDIQTAADWLAGFGCAGTAIVVGNATGAPEMVAVLSDHRAARGDDCPCAVATEEQTLGIFGGDVDALTLAYADDIATIGRVLGMPPDAPICEFLEVAPADCALENLLYEYTGAYWQGMFTSPLYYAQNFAAAWMFEYVSGIDDFAWGLLDGAQVVRLHEAHIAMCEFGSNHWNARADGSNALGWIAAALVQRATGDAIGGGALSNARPADRVVALFVHDMNQLYLRRLLGVSWIARGWNENAASTGGALIFELHCETGGAPAHDRPTPSTSRRCFVKTVYAVASPEQQRRATPLSAAVPPSVATLVLPACGVALCPLADFVAIAIDAICLDCVEAPLRAVLRRLEAKGAADPDPAVMRGRDGAPPMIGRRTLFLLLLLSAAGCAVFAALFGLTRRVLRDRRGPSLLGALARSVTGAVSVYVEISPLVEPSAVVSVYS